MYGERSMIIGFIKMSSASVTTRLAHADLQQPCGAACMVTHIARVRINRIRLPILLVVS